MSDIDDPEGVVQNVQDDPRRLRELLEEVEANEGMRGLRLGFQYRRGDDGGYETVLFLTHTLGPDVEKAALENAVPTFLRCHEGMMVRVVNERTSMAELAALREVAEAAKVTCSTYLGKASRSYIGPQKDSVKRSIQTLDAVLAKVPK